MRRTEAFMPGFFIRAAVVALGLWLASQIVPGIAIASPGTLIAAAILLGVVNAIVRPVLIILTLPITLLTLGIFLLVINGLMIELVAWLLPGFHVAGLWPAMLAAIVVSITSWVVTGFIGSQGRVEVVTRNRVIDLNRTGDGRYG
jgi:putative membrane protein